MLYCCLNISNETKEASYNFRLVGQSLARCPCSSQAFRVFSARVPERVWSDRSPGVWGGVGSPLESAHNFIGLDFGVRGQDVK